MRIRHAACQIPEMAWQKGTIGAAESDGKFVRLYNHVYEDHKEIYQARDITIVLERKLMDNFPVDCRIDS